MKRNFVVGLFGGLVGFGMLFILLSAAGVVGARGADRPRDQARPGAVSAATPLTLTFTYQGQLKNGGNAVNGSCGMAFRLYDDPGGGNLIGSPITTTVSINNGLFTVGLNFGNSAVTGIARWLDIRVRCPAGSGSYTTLTPRQALTPAPVALTFGAPGGVSGYLVADVSGPYYPTIGFNTSGPTDGSSYLAGVAGYGGLFQFNDETGDLGYYTGSNVPAGASHFNTQRLVIKQDGRVGIGETDPLAKLEVRGEGPNIVGDAALVFSAVDSNGIVGLSVYKSGYVSIGTFFPSTTVHVCKSSDFLATCSSAAEYVPSIDGGFGFPETADLVSIAPAATNPYGDTHGPFTVQKSSTACDPNLLGFIVKPESGADGEKKNEHYLPLAIYGYFPAKVTLENGAIKRGDPLTSSSKSGYAMKATQACKIIGYALEDADHEGTIQVFANQGENAVSEVASLRTQVQELKQQNAALDARLTALEQKMSGQAPTQSAAPRDVVLFGAMFAIVGIVVGRRVDKRGSQ
jgi:hypothetical protein